MFVVETIVKSWTTKQKFKVNRRTKRSFSLL